MKWPKTDRIARNTSLFCMEDLKLFHSILSLFHLGFLRSVRLVLRTFAWEVCCPSCEYEAHDCLSTNSFIVGDTIAMSELQAAGFRKLKRCYNSPVFYKSLIIYEYLSPRTISVMLLQHCLIQIAGLSVRS